jgi:hypothetical protein
VFDYYVFFIILQCGVFDYYDLSLLFLLFYSVLCRQVMKNIDDMPSVITINDTVQIQVTGDETVDVAIVSLCGINLIHLQSDCGCRHCKSV